MKRTHRLRLISSALLLIGAALVAYYQAEPVVTETDPAAHSFVEQAKRQLPELAVKGRAPKTGYERARFGDGWAERDGCDMRNIILARDLRGALIDDECRVERGRLDDPYSGRTIEFVRGAGTSAQVQIDHVVSLSNAWQTGAQALSPERRAELSNDPLNLLTVEGNANQQKSDGDAATWLPAHKLFRCQYVARQVHVKTTYELWVTPPERDAIERVLQNCR